MEQSPPQSTPPAASSAKKRPRLTAVTPVGILRHRKRRNGPSTPVSAGPAMGRKVSGNAGTKPRNNSVAAALHDGANTPEGRSRRNSVAASSAISAERSNSTPLPSNPEGADVDNDSQDDGDNAEDEPLAGAGDSDDDETTLIRQGKDEVREMWEQMSDEQRQRYGVYRQAALNKGAVKKLVSQVLNQQVSPTLAFVIAGFSKVFVGEIVERAVQIQTDRGDQGPLTPDHLRDAYRLYKKESPVSSTAGSGFTRRMF
ncbi:transcription initiation factor TFIID subunit 11 [Coemansia sp. RSA 552]|nr:transcription initiation factor TFIID subunit 11 [Coemansia sp. RSA 552]